MTQDKNESGVLNIEDAAEYLRINTGTFRNKYKEYGVPYFNVGSLVRFQKASLDVWLKKQEKLAVEKLRNEGRKDRGEL